MSHRSQSVEDYLKAIYSVSRAGEAVTTSALAARLEVTPASVTGMVKKLAGLGLVTHRPYQGVELTERIRESSRLRLIPILMLTARTEEEDEIAGLDAGADDYLPKPVSPRRFVTRVQAILRRTAREDAASTAQLRVHDLVVDRERYLVERPTTDESFRLPRKEFELLYFLSSHPGRVFTREELLNGVWGPDVYVVDRTVDVHVRKIREKIGSDYIETVKGVGYRLAETLGEA